MRSIQRYLLYLAIMLMPIQDSILGKSFLGYVGSNISFAPIALSAFLGILIWMYHGRLTISRRALIWFSYTAGLSVLYIFLWGTQSHGFSVIHKTFAEGFVFFLWAYTIFYIDYTPSFGLKISTYIAFGVLIFGVLACDLHLPGLAALGSSSIVHITVSEEADRWRAFSTEPSMFSATVVSLGLASAHFSHSKFVRGLFVILTMLLLLASRSKGGLLVLALSAFVILFVKKPSFLRMMLYFAVCSLLGGAMLGIVIANFNSMDLIQTTGTLATRFSLAVWTFIVICHHPLGVGFSGFYQAITFYLPGAMDFVARVSPIPLNFMEIAEYVTGTDVPLDAKCFLLEYIASFGIPFLIAYFRFGSSVIRSLSKQGKNILLIAFVFLLIGFSTYVNGMTLYAAFYIAGLAYREHLHGDGSDAVADYAPPALAVAQV